ncbi:MAG: hypothetical protein IIX29_07815 [Bacteroidales bacterium]|nr:hypothetical protein [Bacteroidales bacterium]
MPIMNQGLRTFDAEREEMNIKPGRYEILYGASSADQQLKKINITIK